MMPNGKKPLPAWRIDQRRRRLLAQLRRESHACSQRRLHLTHRDTPALAALVLAAYEQRNARRVYFEGVLFPVKESWCRNVQCPETGMVLVGVSGGWLV